MLPEINYKILLDTNRENLTNIDEITRIGAGKKEKICYVMPYSLEANTTYYWKITAISDRGKESESPTWSFKTKSSTIGPIISTHQKPVIDNRTAIKTSSQGVGPNITWTTPSDSNKNVIFKTNFEDYAKSTTPKEFSIQYNGKGDNYQVITTDESHSGLKSLQLWGTPGWSSNVYYYFNKPETGRIGFEVMAKANPNEEGWIQFINPEGSEWGWGWGGVLFDSDGYIKAPATSSNPYKKIQSEDKWYKVRSEMDVKTGACWVWIDDELVVNGVTPAEAGRENPDAYKGIRCVAFGDNSWYEDPSTPTYFDDLTIYTVSTGDET
ncbi:MAG: hypothetical protein MUO26_00205 [Methanotrichaceae archaeon]|nr:hypothetical protein [Methanotrichaceae archaeon]